MLGMAALPIVHVGAPLASIKGKVCTAHGYAPPTPRAQRAGAQGAPGASSRRTSTCSRAVCF